MLYKVIAARLCKFEGKGYNKGEVIRTVDLTEREAAILNEQTRVDMELEQSGGREKPGAHTLIYVKVEQPAKPKPVRAEASQPEPEPMLKPKAPRHKVEPKTEKQ